MARLIDADWLLNAIEKLKVRNTSNTATIFDVLGVLDDVEKIHELDDSISSLEDLMEHPNYEAMLEKVKNGSNLVDAYKLVNFDLLMGKSSKEGAERTYKNVTNKSHIRTTSGGATNDVHVPSDVMAMYKKNMPSWTEEQIKKHYASAVKGE